MIFWRRSHVRSEKGRFLIYFDQLCSKVAGESWNCEKISHFSKWFVCDGKILDTRYMLQINWLKKLCIGCFLRKLIIQHNSLVLSVLLWRNQKWIFGNLKTIGNFNMKGWLYPVKEEEATSKVAKFDSVITIGTLKQKRFN